MTLLVRHTDVLGGIVGGWNPLVPFLGWRQYAVNATFVDPDGLELPVIRFIQTSGPATDTVGQIMGRNQSYLVDKVWPMSPTLLRGSYPELAWYFLDPATLALVAGPLLPVGDKLLQESANLTGNTAQFTAHYVQWFEATLPTGPYIGIMVAREPSSDFPVWVSGEPVEIIEERLTAKGEAYEAASAASARASLGVDQAVVIPLTNADQTPQELIDGVSEMWGVTLRRGLSGAAEFVHWRQKISTLPVLVLDNNSIREAGGPTFDLSDVTRISRVVVHAPAVTVWKPGTVMVPVVTQRKFLGIPVSGGKVRWVSRPAPLGPDKPASGLVITTNTVAFDYSTDGVTADSLTYGEQTADIELVGMPAFIGSGTAYQTNLEQFAEGIARKLFDTHARGRQMLTAVGIRETDFDLALLGEAVTVSFDHLPDARLGQTPPSQRLLTSGEQRPFRVIDRTEVAGPGPICTLADEGTGVQYALTPTLRLWTDPFAIDILRVEVSDAATLAGDGAQVEFQVRVFGPLVSVGLGQLTDPGVSYTVKDSTLWPDDPQMLRLGPFPPIHQVFVRVRAWLYGGAASDWSTWYGLGGPVTGPQTTLSGLVISNITNVGADLDWSYDESPQVGDVKVQYRDITSGFVGAYTTFSTLAPGTESETLTGLVAGSVYEVRIVLIDGALAEYGDVLTGSFVATGGLISGLSVSSVTASEAKLAWTNTDGGRLVVVEYRVTGDPLYQTYAVLPATSNRLQLRGLQASTAYDVQVSLAIALSSGLLPYVTVGDGAGGPSLTDSFTTLAVSVQLEFPLMGGPFWDWDPQTALRYDGRFGVRLNANPNNPYAHDIVVLVAVETSVGSDTPGTYVEQTPIPASPGVDIWFIADAPNDGKWRYLKAISRAVGYTDSIETVVVTAKPWSATSQPPAGGGIPNSIILPNSGGISLATNASTTGSFTIPDGAELYQVASQLNKDIRIRLYMNSTVLASDSARAVSDWQNWPQGLLFDSTILSTDSFVIPLPAQQRVRFILDQHENREVWYRLTNLESTTQTVSCTLYYVAAPAGGGGGGGSIPA